MINPKDLTNLVLICYWIWTWFPLGPLPFFFFFFFFFNVFPVIIFKIVWIWPTVSAVFPDKNASRSLLDQKILAVKLGRWFFSKRFGQNGTCELWDLNTSHGLKVRLRDSHDHDAFILHSVFGVVGSSWRTVSTCWARSIWIKMAFFFKPWLENGLFCFQRCEEHGWNAIWWNVYIHVSCPLIIP